MDIGTGRNSIGRLNSVGREKELIGNLLTESPACGPMAPEAEPCSILADLRIDLLSRPRTAPPTLSLFNALNEGGDTTAAAAAWALGSQPTIEDLQAAHKRLQEEHLPKYLQNNTPDNAQQVIQQQQMLIQQQQLLLQMHHHQQQQPPPPPQQQQQHPSPVPSQQKPPSPTPPPHPQHPQHGLGQQQHAVGFGASTPSGNSPGLPPNTAHPPLPSSLGGALGGGPGNFPGNGVNVGGGAGGSSAAPAPLSGLGSSPAGGQVKEDPVHPYARQGVGQTGYGGYSQQGGMGPPPAKQGGGHHGFGGHHQGAPGMGMMGGHMHGSGMMAGHSQPGHAHNPHRTPDAQQPPQQQPQQQQQQQQQQHVAQQQHNVPPHHHLAHPPHPHAHHRPHPQHPHAHHTPATQSNPPHPHQKHSHQHHHQHHQQHHQYQDPFSGETSWGKDPVTGVQPPHQQHQQHQYAQQQHIYGGHPGQHAPHHGHQGGYGGKGGAQHDRAHSVTTERDDDLQSSSDDTRRRREPAAAQSALMEEFRAFNRQHGGGGRGGGGAAAVSSRQWDIAALRGHMVEFAKDQDGSRLIQRRLADHDPRGEHDAVDMVYQELSAEGLPLMTDVFGNYVIQKILEHGTDRHREGIIGKMEGNVVKLTLQTYGCRVVQKSLETCPLPLQLKMINELDGSVPKCVQDQNGNHVIQKCIECIPENIEFILRAFLGQVRTLATHAYGCRVMQRILEYCRARPESVLAQQCRPVMNEIVKLLDTLIDDQYGNYVLQHVMLTGDSYFAHGIIAKLRHNFYVLSTRKFASNVVEKMFEYASPADRSEIIQTLVDRKTPEGHSELVGLMKDQYANYVAQKIIDLADDRWQHIIVEHVRPHLSALRKFTYGKHIITRVEKITNKSKGRR
eukprot:TRINITY_DN2648_c0_g1_i1.p1 TRINITY_DN2648_c0_g1~~TRINITY_DN2648_c0_g1_i1.p1  ORF type:complete len:894 (+),score=235.46 TRINITY_DN2648_c0_g1_i1:465-3146(+)